VFPGGVSGEVSGVFQGIGDAGMGRNGSRRRGNKKSPRVDPGL